MMEIEPFYLMQFPAYFRLPWIYLWEHLIRVLRQQYHRSDLGRWLRRAAKIRSDTICSELGR